MQASPDRWAICLTCSASQATRELDRPASLSPAGAPWLVSYDLSPERGAAWKAGLRGRAWSLWRYRELLPLSAFDRRIDLGEGGTPLVRLRRLGRSGADVWLKDESGNPSGSFKARGLSLAVNRASELGAPGVQLPSAGNAALAVAAYAAAAGLPCRVAVPSDTPGTVISRCRAHGAEVLIEGADLLAASRRLAEFEDGYWDLSTLKEPYRVEGKKTMGFELAEQFDWRLPDWIVYPTGGGTGIIGMHKAFDELEALGLISGQRPRFAVVQMTGCAPIVAAFRSGAEKAEPWPDPKTSVWGLRVPRAVGDFLILKALRESGGVALSVDEEVIPGVQEAAARQEGLLVGPEGAAALAGLFELEAAGEIESGQRVVVLQTGHPANYGD